VRGQQLIAIGQNSLPSPERISADTLIEKDLRGNPGGNPANLGASRLTMPARIVKGCPLLRDVKMIDLAKPFLVDLRAKRVADFFIEPIIHPTGFFHRFSVLLPIFKPLPSNDAANRHDGAGESTAGFASSCHTTGQSASGFKNLGAAHVQFFLQSCKNGLCSTEIGHVILNCRLIDFIQEHFPIFHDCLLRLGVSMRIIYRE
jgi:hypothetical protein